MIRSIFAFSALALTATAADASSYSAKPAAPTTERFITRDITSNSTEAACLGATQESRPLVLCQSLAKRAGRLESFAVDGRALAAADLDRCNASAKAQGSKALAAQ